MAQGRSLPTMAAAVVCRITRCEIRWPVIRTLASARAPPGLKPCSAEPRELELVLDGESLEFERLERQQAEPRELQLVLAPEFL